MRRVASTTVLPEPMITSASLGLLMISLALCFLLGISNLPFAQNPNIDSGPITGSRSRQLGNRMVSMPKNQFTGKRP